MPYGTIINALAIVLGSLIGLLLNKNIPEKIKLIVFEGLGLSTILIGIQMAVAVENILAITFSILLGGVIGEWIDLEEHIESTGRHIKDHVHSHNRLFTQGFVTASALFCVGAMAILGPVQEGINGDRTILYTKALLDGFTSIAFAATYGAGVMFAAVPILIYQGSITLLSNPLRDTLSPSMINQLTATGGIIIIGIGLHLLGLKKVKVTNMLPSLFIILWLSFIMEFF